MQTKTVKSIAPLPCGKMLAIIQGAFSLLFMPLFLLMVLISVLVPQPPGAGGPPPVFLAGVFLVMAVFMPLMYAAMGFVMGLLGALIYNWVAKRFGGIQVEVE